MNNIFFIVNNKHADELLDPEIQMRHQQYIMKQGPWRQSGVSTVPRVSRAAPCFCSLEGERS